MLMWFRAALVIEISGGQGEQGFCGENSVL